METCGALIFLFAVCAVPILLALASWGAGVADATLPPQGYYGHDGYDGYGYDGYDDMAGWMLLEEEEGFWDWW